MKTELTVVLTITEAEELVRVCRDLYRSWLELHDNMILHEVIGDPALVVLSKLEALLK